MKTVESLLGSTNYVSTLVKSAKGIASIRFNKVGVDLFIACRQFNPKICEYVDGEWTPLYEGRRLHPFLAVGLPVIAEFEGRVQLAAEADHESLHHLFSEMVDAIRERARVEKAKQKAESFAANSRAKLQRALEYVLSLFGMRSRLLILRVDLYVRPESREWGYTDEADAAFDHFADALARGQIVPDVVGWMAAREEGIWRGRHYHVWVAVDAHEHRAGANLAKLLGEYWVDECVGSPKLGSYFNCFALLKKYRHLGIGTVRCDDANKLLGVFYAVRYLLKESVALIPQSNRPRNFRRGAVQTGYVRKGAPRQNGDGLQIAEEVLLRPRHKKKPATIPPRHLKYWHECPGWGSWHTEPLEARGRDLDRLASGESQDFADARIT